MKIVITLAFAFMIPNTVFAGGTRTEKCSSVASEVIALTGARIQERPEPKAGGYNEYSNPWEDIYSSGRANFCCVSYNAEPPPFGECSTYTRDICVDIRTMEIESDTHENGVWCGY